MSRKIPLLLDPFVRLPQEAGLVVLTSVLGASANWLALRWVYGGLKEFGDEGGDVSVVLVSFMRDFAFWKDGAQKLVRPMLSMFDDRTLTFFRASIWMRRAGRAGSHSSTD